MVTNNDRTLYRSAMKQEQDKSEGRSISLKLEVWDWIDEKAALMRMGRSEFIQELIADRAGMMHLVRPPMSLSEVIK